MTTNQMPDIVREYIINHAKNEHGDFYERRVAIAQELETLSDHARSANLQAIVTEYGTFDQASNRFDAAYPFLGDLFIQAVAPRALTYDGFVQECAKRVRKISIPALTCPFCGKEMVLEGYTTHLSKKQVEEAFFCQTCRYSERVELTFEGGAK